MISFLAEISNVDNIKATLLAFCEAHPRYLSQAFLADGSSLRKQLLRPKHYAKALSYQLKNQNFQFGTAKICNIKTHAGKIRQIHQFTLEDQFVMKLLAKACQPRLMQLLTPAVFSYVPGKSHLQAIQYLCNYLRNRKDVYLLRTDITHYTDSIHVAPDAPLWTILAEFLQGISHSNTAELGYITQLFQQALRPVIQEANSIVYQQTQGIALGTALTPVIANLYLSSVDKLILSQGIGLYLRFGDDIIMADTQPARLLSCDKLLNEKLAVLQLQRQPSKDQYYFVNRAGKAANDSNLFKGSVCFEYLGSKIMADGTIALPVAKQSQVLNDIFQRIDRIYSQLKALPLAIQGPVLCQSISQSFSASPLSCRHQILLAEFINHQPQLKQIDYLIARYIAVRLSGVPGVRAFRKIPYHQLRSWGLMSLCYLRYHPNSMQVIHYA